MGRRKRKLRVHRKGFRVKPTTYKRKGKTIHRKGYYVKPTTYMIKDRGKPGRGPKTITVKKGKLHPYSIRKPARVRHAILAKKVFDDRRVGFLAGIFIALSPMPVLFESRLLLDWMLIPLGALALMFLVDASRDGRGRNIFLFGLFSGFFAITRPNILAVFPFLLLWNALLLWIRMQINMFMIS